MEIIEMHFPIPGFPDYFLTKSGRVFSASRGKYLKSKVHRHSKKEQRPDGSRYLYVSLYKERKEYKRYLHKRYLHRLKAEMFLVGEIKPEIDHIDRNKSNNDLSNLRYVTSRENKLNRNKRRKQNETTDTNSNNNDNTSSTSKLAV